MSETVTQQRLHNLAVEMCRSNPGALTAFVEVLKTDPQRGFDVLQKLNKYSVHGSLLWLCYKDICHGDVPLLIVRTEEGVIFDKLEQLQYAHYKRPKGLEEEVKRW